MIFVRYQSHLVLNMICYHIEMSYFGFTWQWISLVPTFLPYFKRFSLDRLFWYNYGPSWSHLPWLHTSTYINFVIWKPLVCNVTLNPIYMILYFLSFKTSSWMSTLVSPLSFDTLSNIKFLWTDQYCIQPRIQPEDSLAWLSNLLVLIFNTLGLKLHFSR